MQAPDCSSQCGIEFLRLVAAQHELPGVFQAHDHGTAARDIVESAVRGAMDSPAAGPVGSDWLRMLDVGERDRLADETGTKMPQQLCFVDLDGH